MKNRILDDSVRFLFFLSLFSIVSFLVFKLPSDNNELISIFYGIGNIIYLLSGPLYFIGLSVKNMKIVRNMTNIGLIGWTLLVISNIYNIFWVQNQIVINNSLFIFSLHELITIKELNHEILSFIIIIRNYGNPTVNFYYTIIHLLIVLAGFSLGTIFFIKMRTIMSVIEQNLICPICDNKIQDNNQFCYFCGANLRFFRPIRNYG